MKIIISTILFKNAKLNIKRGKKKATQVFQNFGSVGKGQTIFFFRPYHGELTVSLTCPKSWLPWGAYSIHPNTQMDKWLILRDFFLQTPKKGIQLLKPSMGMLLMLMHTLFIFQEHLMDKMISDVFVWQ